MATNGAQENAPLQSAADESSPQPPQTNLPPNISVPVTEPKPPAFPSQTPATRKSERRKSIAPGKGGEEALRQPGKPSDSGRGLFLTPLMNKGKSVNQNEKRKGKSQDAQSPLTTSGSVTPSALTVEVNVFNDPAKHARQCSLDVVAVYMCGDKRKDEDWKVSPFVEKAPQPTKIAGDSQPRTQKDGLFATTRREDAAASGKRAKSPQADGTGQPPNRTKAAEQPRIRKVNWLADKDMLQKLLPNARIMGLGLDIGSHVERDTPIDLRSAASEVLHQLLHKRSGEDSRPVVFIGHGYGTVLIEELLFEKRETVEDEASREELAKATAAAVLLGPPFDNFYNLIKWVTQTFSVSRKSTRLFQAKGGTDLAPDRIWNNFFDSAEKHDVATFGYRENGSQKPNSKYERYQRRLDRFWAFSGHVGNIARIAKSEAARFRNISKAISEAIPVHQLLLAAAKNFQDEVMLDVIRSAKDLNFEYKQKRTILHIAALRGHNILVRYLVQSGKVDLDRGDASGNTPLHIAVQSTYNHGPDMVYDLLRAGAKSGLKNKDNQSAQTLALEGDDVHWDTKKWIKKPPLVDGPSAQKNLERGFPANSHAFSACHNTGVVVREIFAATSEPKKPDEHLPAYKSVQDLIYSDEDPSELFESLKDEGSPREALCRWYHIPMNNMTWVHDLFAKLEIQLWPWPTPHKRSKNHHGRYMNAEATKLQALEKLFSDSGEKGWVVFMPYVSYESADRQQKIAAVVRSIGSSSAGTVVSPQRRSSRFRLKPFRINTNDTMRSSIEDEKDPEALAIKGYLNDQSHSKNKHLNFHIRRTLDQSYYYMLEDTSYRDRSQVVSRWAKKEWPEQEDHNILMVDQLWLWFIKGTDSRPDTIITSFPSREGAYCPLVADDIQGTVLKDENRKSIHESIDLVARIISVCCNSFDRHQHVDSINFLQFFESSIGHVEEEETRLFRRFRQRAKLLHALHEEHRTYQRDRSLLLKRLLDILKESKLLHEVKDILDEIKMIMSVLKDQESIINDLKEVVDKKSFSPKDRQDSEKFQKVLDLIQDSKESFEVMESHTKEVEKGIEHLLDLKQKQANLWEARSSREGTEQAAKQGATVLVFTVVTIIFLPLSFMASFFSLGIAVFPKAVDEVENNWPLSYVSGLLFGISFAFSVPFVWVAFKIDLIKRWWAMSKHTITRHLLFAVTRLLRRSRKIRSGQIEDTGSRWYDKWGGLYKEWVTIITKQDLPFQPDKDVQRHLKIELEPESPDSKPTQDIEPYSDSSSEEEYSEDEVEYDLMKRQKKGEKELLRRFGILKEGEDTDSDSRSVTSEEDLKNQE